MLIAMLLMYSSYSVCLVLSPSPTLDYALYSTFVPKIQLATPDRLQVYRIDCPWSSAVTQESLVFHEPTIAGERSTNIAKYSKSKNQS